MNIRPLPTRLPDTSDIEIILTTIQDEQCIDLISCQREEVRQLYPGLNSYTADIPVFMVLSRAGKAIACGGLRLVSGDVERTAELKRLYVVPEARGQSNGVADLLLKQLEWHALGEGWTTLRLSTAKTMLAANRFYERNGYTLISNYGEYAGSAVANCYEKVLM